MINAGKKSNLTERKNFARHQKKKKNSHRTKKSFLESHQGTLSDKISADKSAENLAWCRKFCPPKNFVRRKFCPPKYFVRRNFVQYYVKLKFYFYGTFSSNGSFQVILIHKSLMWRVSSPTCNVNNIGHLKFTHFKTNTMPSLRFTHLPGE